MSDHHSSQQSGNIKLSNGDLTALARLANTKSDMDKTFRPGHDLEVHRLKHDEHNLERRGKIATAVMGGAVDLPYIDPGKLRNYKTVGILGGIVVIMFCALLGFNGVFASILQKLEEAKAPETVYVYMDPNTGELIPVPTLTAGPTTQPELSPTIDPLLPTNTPTPLATLMTNQYFSVWARYNNVDGKSGGWTVVSPESVNLYLIIAGGDNYPCGQAINLSGYPNVIALVESNQQQYGVEINVSEAGVAVMCSGTVDFVTLP